MEEGGSWGQIEAAAAAVAKLATYLGGKIPFPIEHHWSVMHRFSYFQEYAINEAIYAIDIIFWDIKGKALDVPVYEFLGCQIQDRVCDYGHVYEKILI